MVVWKYLLTKGTPVGLTVWYYFFDSQQQRTDANQHMALTKKIIERSSDNKATRTKPDFLSTEQPLASRTYISIISAP